MKKLMFMLAAVAMVASLQAAKLDWSLAGKAIQDSSGNYMYGQTTYLLTFASSAAADTLYNQLKNGDKTLSEAIGLAVDSAVGGSNSKKNQGMIATTTADATSIVAGNNYYASLLVVDGDKFILSGAAQGLAYDPTSSDPALQEGNAVSFSASNFSTTADSRTGWTTAGGVPEPTSGILMLVGLGALALRRRKA